MGTAVALAVGIPIAYWLISPLFITKEVHETLQDILPATSSPQQVTDVEEPQVETIAQGTFMGLAGHSGEGSASLIKINDSFYVRFEEDFRTTNGPDLFVHLGKNGEYAPEAQLETLKGNAGSQNYKIPESIDITRYNEVWIWCRAFSVPFAKAVLN